MIVKPQRADVGTVREMTRELHKKYPMLKVVPIGGSVLGREIPAIILDKGEETVLMAAAFHGQEWMTSLVLLRLCEDICAALTGSTDL